MSAIQLRNILLGGIGLMIVLIGVTIYYASTLLQVEATKSVHAKIDAELVAADLDRLKNLEKVLERNQNSVQKAAQIVSDTKLYQYQDQIIKDIDSYANKTGVQVTVYDFGATDKPTTSSGAQQPTIPGVKTITVKLTLKSPLPFDNYLRFIKAIEQNLTKMQVSGVNLSPDEDNKNDVSNPGIGLTVYVK